MVKFFEGASAISLDDRVQEAPATPRRACPCSHTLSAPNVRDPAAFSSPSSRSAARSATIRCTSLLHHGSRLPVTSRPPPAPTMFSGRIRRLDRRVKFFAMPWTPRGDPFRQLHRSARRDMNSPLANEDRRRARYERGPRARHDRHVAVFELKPHGVRAVPAQQLRRLAVTRMYRQGQLHRPRGRPHRGNGRRCSLSRALARCSTSTATPTP